MTCLRYSESGGFRHWKPASRSRSGGFVVLRESLQLVLRWVGYDCFGPFGNNGLNQLRNGRWSEIPCSRRNERSLYQSYLLWILASSCNRVDNDSVNWSRRKSHRCLTRESCRELDRKSVV